MSDTSTVVTRVVGGQEHPFGVVDDPSSPPAPLPKSPLALLKERRKELKGTLHTDLKVPRWGSADLPGTPEVFVRYAPVDNKTLEGIIENRSKQGKGWSIFANADILVASCKGVYACLDGDYSKKYSLAANDVALDQAEGVPWTKFDPTLRAALGESEATHPNAADVCRALYWTDGDLLNAATALMEWSGLSAEKLDEDFTSP